MYVLRVRMCACACAFGVAVCVWACRVLVHVVCCLYVCVCVWLNKHVGNTQLIALSDNSEGMQVVYMVRLANLKPGAF